MRDKDKKIGRIKFAREVRQYNNSDAMDFGIMDDPYFAEPNEFQEWRNQYLKQINPRKTVLNRLKRWWAYLTT